MAGITDVAKRAGVSIGTVSRVLNHSGYASEAARRKVEEAVRELQYRPNELARNLLQNKTKNVAMIVPDVANPFFSELVSLCLKELRNHGYRLMLCNTNGQKSNEQMYLDMLNRNMVDGILTCTHSLNTKRYAEVNGPILSFDTICVPGQIPRLTVNHAEGGELAAKELLHAGCRKILQMRDMTPKEHFPYLERHEAFDRVLKDAGVECINVIVKWNEFDNQYMRSLIQECCKTYPDIDGVFATDLWILHYMREARMLGKRIPEDIHFVAYDGSHALDVAYPTVSVIRQPIKVLAKEGEKTLLNEIDGEKPDWEEKRLRVKLIRGMTTMTEEEYKKYMKG
jgi:LacI family sucrose operon transcriptional repressor